MGGSRILNKNMAEDKRFMKIVAQGSGKVLDAAMSDATVIIWEDNGGDNQLWYLDEGPEWGKVYLHTEVHGGYNQRFLRDSQGNIICLGTESEPRWDLRLDVIADDPTEAENGTKVGCYTQEKSGNQKWDFVYVGED